MEFRRGLEMRKRHYFGSLICILHTRKCTLFVHSRDQYYPRNSTLTLILLRNDTLALQLEGERESERGLLFLWPSPIVRSSLPFPRGCHAFVSRDTLQDRRKVDGERKWQRQPLKKVQRMVTRGWMVRGKHYP